MNAAHRYRLAVVDDHRLLRQGIVENLREVAAFEVVAEGSSAEEAVRFAQTLPLDLIFLDVNMPGGGVDAVTRIRAINPTLKIAMFSFRLDLDIVRDCLSAGACGYIVKGISGPAFNEAARRLLAGETVIDADVRSRLSLENPQIAASPRDR